MTFVGQDSCAAHLILLIPSHSSSPWARATRSCKVVPPFARHYFLMLLFHQLHNVKPSDILSPDEVCQLNYLWSRLYRSTHHSRQHAGCCNLGMRECKSGRMVRGSNGYRLRQVVLIHNDDSKANAGKMSLLSSCFCVRLRGFRIESIRCILAQG